jgi:hypothetical protein
MAQGLVLHRITKRLLDVSDVLTYPEENWLRDPDLSGVEGVDPELWVVEGDTVRLANQAEASIVTTTTLNKVKSHKNDACWEAANAVNEKYIQGGALILAYECAYRGNEVGLAIQNWIQLLWGDYYARKAEIWASTTKQAVNNISENFTIHEPMPYSVGVLMAEAVRIGVLQG